MNKEVKTPGDLKRKYPYMFADPDAYISFSKGWFRSFVQLCRDVDELLGDDRNRFHWTQVKEKFGTARFHFELGRAKPGMRTGDAKAQLLKQLLMLTEKAGSESRKQCVVCGAPGTLDETDLHYMTLCSIHIEQRRNGLSTMESAWFGAEDES